MKHIIITGATSGIGEATARLLHERGHKLLLLGRKTQKLEEIRSSLGPGTRAMQADVRSYDDISRCVSEIAAEWPVIDVLVNNAGLGYFDTVAGGRITEWHEMVDVNVKGLLNCIHACLPHLVQSHGQVINLGSVASHHVFPNSGIYCATKHAVLAISESLRMELADKVRVTTISPGSVNTPFIHRTTNEEMLKQYQDYFAAGMTPDLIAQQVLHAIDCPPGSVISEIIVRPARFSK